MNLVETIKEYATCSEQENRDKEIALRCMEIFDDILTRENEIAHITSSAFIVNKKRDKTLMVHHNIFNSWSWAGGHADGEEDLLKVADREVREETGVNNICPVSEDILSLDIIPVLGHIKKGKYVSPHLHISIAYLFEADENEPPIVKADENSGVQWIPIQEIDTYSNEAHMKKIYSKIISKIDAFDRQKHNRR